MWARQQEISDLGCLLAGAVSILRLVLFGKVIPEAAPNTKVIAELHERGDLSLVVPARKLFRDRLQGQWVVAGGVSAVREAACADGTARLAHNHPVTR